MRAFVEDAMSGVWVERQNHREVPGGVRARAGCGCGRRPVFQ